MNHRLLICALFLSCSTACSSGEGEHTASTEDEVQVALPSGCTIDAKTPGFPSSGAYGQALLTCNNFTGYDHSVTVHVERCVNGGCTAVSGTSKSDSIAGGWHGAWWFFSNHFNATHNAVYRTKACASVFSSAGFVIGTKCSTSAAVTAP